MLKFDKWKKRQKKKRKRRKIQIAADKWTEFNPMSDLPESRVLVRVC